MTPPSPREVVDRVERELRELWNRQASSGEAPPTRACTMNLVVVAGEPGSAERWLPVLDDVMRAVPARAILVELDPRGNDALDGDASAVCGIGSDKGICSERIRLTVHGAVGGRIGGVVEALSVSEMPTTLIWLPDVKLDDPAFVSLAPAADRIVVDSRGGDLAGLASLVRWASSRPSPPGVADLAWTRISLWQELCARFFDDPELREASLGVTRVSLVQACEGGASLGSAGALLLGWLSTSLEWQPAKGSGPLRFTRPDGVSVAVALGAKARPGGLDDSALAEVALEAEHGRTKVRATIERELLSGLDGDEPDKDVLVWRLAVVDAAGAGAPRTIEQRMRLHGATGAKLLERTLRRPKHDHALPQAVARAEALARRGLACG